MRMLKSNIYTRPPQSRRRRDSSRAAFSVARLPATYPAAFRLGAPRVGWVL